MRMRRLSLLPSAGQSNLIPPVSRPTPSPVPPDSQSQPSTSETHPLTWAARNLHFAATLAFTLALPFALQTARFPVRYNWPQYFLSYWFVFGIRAVLGAALFSSSAAPDNSAAGSNLPAATHLSSLSSPSLQDASPQSCCPQLIFSSA